MARWIRTVIAIVMAAVLLAVSASSAYADDAPLFKWEPRVVQPGDWEALDIDPPDPYEGTTFACPGVARAWRSPSDGTTLGLVWWTCAADRIPSVAAEVDSVSRRQTGVWAAAGNVLGESSVLAAFNPTDMVEPLGDGHRRVWIEADYLLSLGIACPARDVSECLDRSATAIRDISASLPGEPLGLSSGRSQRSTSWLSGLALLWLLVLAIIAGVRRLARESYPVDLRNPLWLSVEAGARKRRARRRRRRIGFMLVAPIVGSLLAAALQVGLGVFGPLWWAYLLVWAVLLGVPGVILLVSSRDPEAPNPWQGGGRLWSASGVASALLSLLSTGYLALLVVVFLLGASDVVIPLPRMLDDLVHLTFLTLLGLAWPIGLLLRRRAVANSWSALNQRSGPALTYVRTGGVNAKIRADPGPSLGLLNWVARQLAPGRKQQFENVLLRDLASHAPVVVVQSEHVRRATAAWRPLGPRVIVLPTTDWAPAHDAMGASQAIVLVADNAVTQDDVEILRQSLRAAVNKPLILVLPPYPAGSVQQRWEAMRRALADEVVFADLDPSLITPGTQVAARVPGRGWRAWGATYRDEWTLREAVREAVIFTGQDEIGRAGVVDAAAVRASASTLARPTSPVHVLASGAHHSIGAEIARELSRMGMPAKPVTAGQAGASDAAATFVVVMGADALLDHAWQAEVSRRAAEQRPVVVYVDVDPNDAPESLRSVQHIEWRESDRATSIAEIFVGVAANPKIYERHRDLLARARRWADSGRATGLLIADFDAAQEALHHLADAASDPLARPGALLHNYATASYSRAVNRRRRRRGLQATGVVALVMAIIVVASFVIYRSSSARTSLLVTQILAAGLIEDRPDVTALRAGALLVQGGDAYADMARRGLLAALDSTWAIASIGAGHDSPMTGATVVTQQGVDKLLTTDSLGTLTQWDIRTGTVQWRRGFLDPEAATAIAANSDGSVVVVGNGKTVHIVKTLPWARVTVSAPGDVTRVAVSAEGRTIAAATAAGQVIVATVGATSPARVLDETFDGVLDMQAYRADRLRALVVRSGGRLAVVELPSGDIVAEVAAPEATQAGTISPDGATIAVASVDRELRMGAINGPLMPIGQPHASRVDDLLLLSSRLVAVASPAFGVQIIDGPTGLITARLTPAQEGVAYLRASADGRYLLTSSGYGVHVWSTTGLGPQDERPAVVEFNDTASAIDGDFEASGDATGLVTVTKSDAMILRSIVVNGSVTAVATDGLQLLVGSDLGEVAQVDLATRSVTRRWNLPSGGRVAALGWSPDHERILVKSGTGLWWSADACDRCGTDSGLLDELKSRIWTCYGPDAFVTISAETQERLGLRVCPRSPKAQEG